MPVAEQDHVGPDLVRNDLYIIFPAQLRELKYLLPAPYSAAGVVGRAEYRRVNAAASDLLLHILKIHAPDTLRILFERRVDDIVTAVF